LHATFESVGDVVESLLCSSTRRGADDSVCRVFVFLVRLSGECRYINLRHVSSAAINMLESYNNFACHNTLVGVKALLSQLFPCVSKELDTFIDKAVLV
jgi:hypothetical protein